MIMNSVKELRRKLGEKYYFNRLFFRRQINQLQEQPPEFLMNTTAAVLIAGCVKIEAVLIAKNGSLFLGYEMFVKDDPGSAEWILYDIPVDKVKLKESEMLSVLDRIVRQNGLSYVECCFKRVEADDIDREQNKKWSSDMERTIRLGSLFDGIGGFSPAAARNGMHPVWASEINRYSRPSKYSVGEQ